MKLMNLKGTDDFLPNEQSIRNNITCFIIKNFIVVLCNYKNKRIIVFYLKNLNIAVLL